MRVFQYRIAAILIAFLSLSAMGKSEEAQTQTDTVSEALSVSSAGGVHDFAVEVVDTKESMARGLMHREHLDQGAGMLFDFKRVRHINFWMKNTLIPLDIIFIRADGTIANIAENTTPLSEESIPAAEPVLGVLEINGGLSAKLGIKAGDRVHHRIFGNAEHKGEQQQPADTAQ